jgi:hypothetical protein
MGFIQESCLVNFWKSIFVFFNKQILSILILRKYKCKVDILFIKTVRAATLKGGDEWLSDHPSPMLRIAVHPLPFFF